MSATNKKGGLFGMMNFKVKNPINNFKDTFKKIIDQQCKSAIYFNSHSRDYCQSNVLPPLVTSVQHGMSFVYLINLM